MVGYIEPLTCNVNDLDELPIFVLPLYVSTVIVPTPLKEFGICCAKELSGVHEQDVVALELIVPLAEPKAYKTLCVKDELAREMLIVPALPHVNVGTVKLDARGIVGSVTEVDNVPHFIQALFKLAFAPCVYDVSTDTFNVNVQVPSLLWVTVL